MGCAVGMHIGCCTININDDDDGYRYAYMALAIYIYISECVFCVNRIGNAECVQTGDVWVERGAECV